MDYLKPRESSGMVLRLLPPLKDGVCFKPITREFENYPPVKRYLWPVIDRSKPDSPPLLWDASRSVHEQLLKHLVEAKIPIELPWWKRLWNWLLRRPTPTTSALDLDYGHDLTVELEYIDRFPKYTVRWDNKSQSVGTPAERASWLANHPMNTVL